MIKKHLHKLKKYLFLISLFVFISLFFHILYTYIYYDAKSVPIKWGTVSEWIIWDFPSLNPLIWWNEQNKYIVNLLYRSLLKYNIKEKKIESDLANCDLSNLANIECYLENNIFWSNKDPITIKDIVSTYDVLKTTNTNPVMKSLLADITIEEKANSILFKNKKNSVNSLNIFFQPILSEKQINNLWIEELSKVFKPGLDSLYSWKFKISAIKWNKILDIEELILEKNENYHNNTTYIDKYDIKFFKNINSLISNKDLINIYYDDKNLVWNSIPRLASHNFYLPKYTALFLNADNIKSKKLRNFILSKIDKDELINLLWWDKKYKKIINPYISDYEIDKNTENKNIDWMMEYMWYFKKAKLAKLLSEKNSNQVTDKKDDKQASSTEEFEKNINKKLQYIDSWLEKKYSFVSEDNILLKWNTQGHSPDAVYFNDYKLQWYKAWSSIFYYRLKLWDWYDSIKEGINEYKIFFEKDWKKEQKEDFVVYYYKDKNKLQEEKDKLYSTYAKVNTSTWTEKSVDTKEKENSESNLLSKELNSIDDNFYYNKSLEKFTLKLFYIWWDQDVVNTASYINEVLREYGLIVEPVSINLSDVSKVVSNTSSWTYDMFLAWINLGYFDFNLYSYFHSSQAKNWYNFSNLKKLSLDIILEEINSNKIPKDSLPSEQNKALDIIKEEQVVKTLYTPIQNLLVDKNIKNVNFPKNSTWSINRLDYLSKIYISEKSEINISNKWIINFFKYIIHIITW